MKVLSIRQPWASLIINGYKNYEFRSWSTGFRGQILIHASQNIEKNQMKRYKHLNLEYPTGCILGSVEIIECLEVNKPFEDKLIHEDELIYGVVKGRTGYAFKVQNSKKLDVPIKVKGQLGIWNYYSEIDIMELMDKIQYGWVDKENKTHLEVDELYADNYKLQSPKELIKNELGVCWDQVELERYYFKNTICNSKTYFLCYYADNACPTHTFFTYEKGNKIYWFEHAWEKYRGIHEYNSVKELLKDAKTKFITTILNNDYQKDNLLLREYVKPTYGITTQEFYHHAELEKPIDIEIL